MDYCYVLEISFLRVHAYSVILKAHLQIHIHSLFSISSSDLKVFLKLLLMLNVL